MINQLASTSRAVARQPSKTGDSHLQAPVKICIAVGVVEIAVELDHGGGSPGL